MEKFIFLIDINESLLNGGDLSKNANVNSLNTNNDRMRKG